LLPHLAGKQKSCAAQRIKAKGPYRHHTTVIPGLAAATVREQLWGCLGQKKKTLPELFAATYWRRVLGAFFWIQTKEIKKIV